MLKYLLLIVVSVSLLAAISSAQVENDEDTSPEIDAKLVKNFGKINDYLEKKVSSDDIAANIEKAQEWLRGKSKSLLPGGSIKEALKVFISLPAATIKSTAACNEGWSRKLVEQCDSALSDDAHLKTGNYPLRRIDRILESVFYKNVRLCLSDRSGWPRVRFANKERAYDFINGYLVDRVANDNPEANMRAAEDMLQTVENQEGSHATALKQLLALKSVLTEDSCNEQGLEIVLKNDLAITNRIPFMSLTPTNRIGKVVHHYSSKHSKICIPIHRSKCLSLLNQLDAQTYRRVLALTSSTHVKKEEYDRVVAALENEEVNENFISQFVAIKDRNSRIFTSSQIFEEDLYYYLRAAAKQDPRLRYLCRVDDERSGQKVVDVAKISELYDDYIHNPCDKFVSLMKSDMQIYEYYSRTVNAMGNDEPLNFRMMHSAYEICQYLTHRRESKLSGVISISEEELTYQNPRSW